MNLILVLMLALVACAAVLLSIHAARIAYEDDINGDRLHGSMFAMLFLSLAVMCVAYIVAAVQ